MKPSKTVTILAGVLLGLAPSTYAALNLVSAYVPADFSASTAADFPQVSAPLVGSLPSDLYFDVELVDISSLNSSFGSFIGAGFLNSGNFLGEFQIGADTDIGSSDGIFGDLRGNNGTTSASIDSGGIPEATRVWFRLSSNGDTVTAQVINQADESVIYSGLYSIPGAQTADALIVRTYDNEGTITPTLVTGGAEDYWEIRATRSGVDMTVNFYGVSVIPEPATYTLLFGALTLCFVMMRRHVYYASCKR